MSEALQYCTFTVDGQFLGVEVSRVQEVIRYQEMTGVPLASGVVRGLINLRGQIVTALDLRVQLGLTPAPADSLPMNVVVQADDGAVSLLVDEIGDVVEVDEATYERAPDTLRGPCRDLVTGTYKLPGRLLLVLDVDRTVTVSNREGEAA